MPAQHEKQAILENRLNAVRASVVRVIGRQQSVNNSYLQATANMSHILNINNLERDYQIPDLPLNEVYPGNVLPIAVNKGEIYNDDYDVRLEELDFAGSIVRQLSPTTTLYNRYLDAGFSEEEAINSAHESFNQLRLQQIEYSDREFTTLDIRDLSVIEDNLRKLENAIPALQSIITTAENRITDANRQIRRIFAISERVTGEESFGLNAVYDPDELSTRVGSISAYKDDFDMAVEQLNNLFDVASYNASGVNEAIRNNLNAGVSHTQTQRNVRADSSSLVLQAQSYQEPSKQIYDIDFFAAQLEILENAVEVTTALAYETLYKQTSLRNQFPETLDLVLQNIIEEVRQNVEEQREEIEQEIRQEADSDATEEEIQEAVQVAVEEQIAEDVLQDFVEITEVQEEVEEVQTLQEDDEVLEPILEIETPQIEVPETERIGPTGEIGPIGVEEEDPIEEPIVEEAPSPSELPPSQVLLFNKAKLDASLDAGYINLSVPYHSVKVEIVDGRLLAGGLRGAYFWHVVLRITPDSNIPKPFFGMPIGNVPATPGYENIILPSRKSTEFAFTLFRTSLHYYSFLVFV